MSADGEVRMYLQEVRVQIDGATEKALAAAAMQLEGMVKVQIRSTGQVDTGFMMNSAYAVTRREDSYAAAAAAASAANPKARMGPRVALPGDADAAVVVGAEYAVHQEVRQSFLYAAGEQLARQVGGTIEAVYREEVGD